jgi:hypothetical protein
VVATTVYLEVGSKRAFACAVDWPGWSRAGRTPEAALEALADYADRYAEVARRANARFAKTAGDDLEVVERVKGNATTEFGAPGVVADIDREPLSRSQAARWSRLLEASWSLLDDVVAGAPASLRKGPRGGGRDRDKMYAHVLDAERAYGRKLGIAKPASFPSTEEFRREVLAIARRDSDGSPLTDNGWPPRYVVRRIAWHVLDHAWEMQDRSD